MKLRICAVLLASSLAACATPPSATTPASPPTPAPQRAPGATLPADVTRGVTDPARRAIFNTSYAFSAPRRLAGRPADAARAIAEVEFLTVDFGVDQRWREFPASVPLAFQNARPEWRAAAGIAADAEPQAVIDALFAARRALLQGDTAAAAAALTPPMFQGGGNATLGRLSALPVLRRTAAATRSAENELARRGSGRR